MLRTRPKIPAAFFHFRALRLSIRWWHVSRRPLISVIWQVTLKCIKCVEVKFAEAHWVNPRFFTTSSPSAVYVHDVAKMAFHECYYQVLFTVEFHAITPPYEDRLRAKSKGVGSYEPRDMSLLVTTVTVIYHPSASSSVASSLDQGLTFPGPSGRV